MAFDLVVTDLSHWNEVDSFVEAQASGLIGVIHKATQGTNFFDDKYTEREADARVIDLCWSSYHFLEHGDPQAQMEWYLECARPLAGERVCIDFEENPNGPDATLDDLRGAISAVRSLDPSLQITVYGGSLLKELLGTAYDETLASTSLWVAQYRDTDPVWPTGTWKTWSLHQYSDGSVGGYPRSLAGLGAPHDCNRFNGSRSQCEKWFGPAEQSKPIIIPSPPIIVPELEETVITLTVKGPLTVVINGRTIKG
jgi:lysozyme